MKSLFSCSQNNYSHSCSVIYFTNELHAKLEIDERMYNLVCKGNPSFGPKTADRNYDYFSSSSRLRQQALAGRESSEHIAIRLGVTKGEYQEIRKALAAKNISMNTCSGAIANLLNRIANISIPVFQALLPSGLALYLWDTKELSSSRVKQIEYYGCGDQAKVFGGRLFIGGVELSKIFRNERKEEITELAVMTLIMLVIIYGCMQSESKKTSGI